MPRSEKKGLVSSSSFFFISSTIPYDNASRKLMKYNLFIEHKNKKERNNSTTNVVEVSIDSIVLYKPSFGYLFSHSRSYINLVLSDFLILSSIQK